MTAYRIPRLTSCLISATLLCSNASAAVIYSLDFNTETGTPGDYNPNYDQADPGGISTKGYVASVGDDGSRALQVDFDTTGDPFSVSYFTNLSSSSVDSPTSISTADYTLSFDVRIDGFDGDDSSVFSQYSITLGDEKFEGSFNATASYQTIEVSLDSLTNTGASSFDLSDFTGTQQFRVAFLGLNNKFDLDNNNSYFVDNIKLAQIPEPSSIALLGVVGLGFLVRRRR